MRGTLAGQSSGFHSQARCHRDGASCTGPRRAEEGSQRLARSTRHEPGSHERIRRALAELLRSLLGIASGRHRGGVAQIAGYLLKGHPVVWQKSRCGTADRSCLQTWCNSG